MPMTTCTSKQTLRPADSIQNFIEEPQHQILHDSMDYNHFRNNLSIDERLAAQQEARRHVKQSTSSLQFSNKNEIVVDEASSFPHYILQTLQERAGNNEDKDAIRQNTA